MFALLQTVTVAPVARFSTQDILLILGGLGTLVTVMGGVLVQVITSFRKTIDDNAKAQTLQIAQVQAKADVIEGHVNSAATAAIAKRAALEDTVADLKALIAEQRQTAALSVQAAIRPGGQPMAVEVVNKPDTPVLVKDAAQAKE